MVKCFVSSSVEDQEFVESEVLRLVEALGLEAWFAPADIRPAGAWDDQLTQGLETCDWFILVMSEHSAKSEWVKDELNWAITHRPRRVIPIRLDDCNPASFGPRLERLQFIDYGADQLNGQKLLIEQLLEATKTPGRSLDGLKGTWEGVVHQFRGPTGAPIDFRIRFDLAAGGDRVTGTMRFDFPLPPPIEEIANFRFTVVGRMSHERFMRLDYNSEDSGMVQFGTFLLELSDLGKRMEGMFVGYGAVSRRIIGGDLTLLKK